MANSDETSRVLRDYAKAWLASDLEKVLASYHDDIELHYTGRVHSPELIAAATPHSPYSLKIQRALLAS